MGLNIKETVEKTLFSFSDWKPFGWHKSTQGRFENNFNKNIKQVISDNYQAVEVYGANFCLILSQGYNSKKIDSPKFYRLEIWDRPKTKLLYSKQQQDTQTMEKGSWETASEIIKNNSFPFVYFVPDSTKRNQLFALQSEGRG